LVLAHDKETLPLILWMLQLHRSISPSLVPNSYSLLPTMNPLHTLALIYLLLLSVLFNGSLVLPQIPAAIIVTLIDANIPSASLLLRVILFFIDELSINPHSLWQLLLSSCAVPLVH
jgi:hypothetical protein